MDVITPSSECFRDKILGSALRGNGKATIIGFGTFSVSRRDARSGRNPRTGQTITIAAKNVVKFKPGKDLVDSVN